MEIIRDNIYVQSQSKKMNTINTKEIELALNQREKNIHLKYLLDIYTTMNCWKYP